MSPSDPPQPFPGAAASFGLEARDLATNAYRVLFEQHPHPMWVYDLETLRFLAVNEAAVRRYGYDRDEFLAMTIADIRPPEDVPDLLANVARVTEGVDAAGVWRHQTRDGRVLFVEITSHALRFGDHAAELVLAVDVTTRQLAAAAGQLGSQRHRELAALLQRERDRNATAQGAAKIGSWETDLLTLQVYWSEETFRIFGLDPQQFVPTHETFLERVHPDDRAAVDLAFRESFASREPCVIEHRIRTADGTEKVVEEHWRTFVDERGTPVRAVGTCQDITTRWHAAAALRALQARHHRLFDEDLTGNYLCRPDGQVLLCNASLATLLKLAAPTDVGRAGELLFADRHEREQLFAALRPDRPAYQLERWITTLGGEPRLVVEKLVGFWDGFGQLAEVQGYLLDVTESFRARAALRASEERFRGVFRDAAVGIAITDASGRFLQANAAYCAMLGYSEQELLELDLFAVTHPEDRERAAHGAAQLLAGQLPSLVYEKRYLARSGKIAWARLSVAPLRDERGIPSGLIRVAEDITRQRATQTALEQSQALLRMASQLSRLGAWVVELPSRQLVWSEEVRAMHEVPPDFEPSLDSGLAFYDPADRPTIEAAIRRCIEEGERFDLEVRLVTAGGRRAWVRTIGEAVRNADGTVARVHGAFQDISERREAEQRIRRQQSLVRMAGRVARVGGWAIDLPSWQTSWSDELCEMLDFPPGSTPSLEEVLALLPPEARAAVAAAAEACAAGATPFDLEVEVGTTALRSLTVRVRGEADVDTDGRVVRIHGAVQDVTAQKLTERQAGDLAHRLTTTLESISDGFFTLDNEWCFTYLNRQAETLLGRRREDLLGHNLWAEFPAAVGAEFERAFRLAAATGESVELEEHYPSPLDAWFSVRAHPTPQGLAVYFRDVTETRAARDAVRASDERFRLLANTTTDAIYDWDLRTDALWWNEGFERLFGYARDQVEPTVESWTRRVHPDDLRSIEPAVERAMTTGAESWTGEYRFLRHDGTWAFVLDRGRLIRDEGGRPIRMVGGMTDLSERKQTEERLAEQAALLDAAHDAIVLLDLDGRVVYWNRGAERAYGWSSGEVLGLHATEAMGEEPGHLARALASALGEGQWQGESQHHTRDGRPRTVEVSFTLIRDADQLPRSVLSINTDVTERKSLETQLLRAQRLESIGTLAGGIAHDLNNVLTPVLMAVDLLATDEVDPRRQAILRSLQTSAQRGADLVRQVLSFARGFDGPRTRVDAGAVATEVHRIVRDTFPRNVSVELRTAPSLWPVVGDSTQVHQVLMNLCLNARDAMPNGGLLQIDLVNRTVDEAYAALNPSATPGPYVEIRVADTGCGIPQTVLDRIFEPFFTTKPVGEGTGLGLSTVHSIVRSHRGFVNVYSEPGKGSKFKVYFPADVDGRTAEAARQEQSSLPRGEGEVVLVIDDEESIREVARGTLERYGYRVLLAAHGAEAVSIYAQRRSEIDLVLTDMSMPVMDGPATILALKSIDPTVRVIGSSGLAGNQFVTKAMGAGVRYFVAKPYTADSLLRTLRRALSDDP
jgi:PAS domain S-box-containing protein